MTLNLSEMLEADATFNLISGGKATYGTSNDWNLSVGGVDCNTATEDSPCPVTISRGDTTAEVSVAVNTDTDNESSSETFTVSVEVASGSASIVQVGSTSSLTFTIPADPPLPTVSLSAGTNSITEGNTGTITLTLNQTLGSSATFNLIEGGTGATYGTSSSSDWNLSVSGTDCNTATRSNPCQVTISRGITTAEVTVETNTDTAEPPENFTVSVVVDPESITLVTPGRSSSLDFTIEGAPTVSLNYNGSTTLNEAATAPQYTVTIELSEVLTRDVLVNIRGTGSATYRSQGVGDYMLTNGTMDCPGDTGSQCQATIPAGQMTLQFVLSVPDDFQVEPTENVTVSIFVDTASRDIVIPGSNSSVRFDILDAG